MINRHLFQTSLMLVIGVLLLMLGSLTATAQVSDETLGDLPKPIMLTEPKESFDERMDRKITLDVRDMNIVDVIKFLAQKGEFNVVVSPTVDGRTTVLLNSVAIKDAMDIVIISNKLAYMVENNIIHVMTSSEYETLYGKQFGDKTQVEIVHLQYAKPSYVLAALDNMKSNIGKIIIDEDTGSVVLVDTPKAIETMKKAIVQIEKPLDTLVFNLKYARADVVAEKLRTKIDAKAVGTITSDERSNQVLVRVFPGRRGEVEQIIQSLDEPTKEVLIEAKVLQVILKPHYDVGIDWAARLLNSEGERRAEVKNIALGETAPTSDSPFGVTTLSDNLGNTFGKIAIGTIDQDNFALSVRAVQGVSDTKLLSSPQILVTNNEEARIHIGDTVPYIISTTNGTGDNAVTSEDVRFIDVGLKLNVMPVINDEGMVTMKLRPEISSVVAKVDSDGGGIPQVNKTEVETSVMVKDGQTIILAGLKKDEKAHVRKGIPMLMDIPYIGNAFGRTADSITQTEIIILITPHIIKPNQDYSQRMGQLKPTKAYSK